ncbi:MAG: VCBS repeat-containing protein [Planctomycetes bacterium]|nr:VCBS repeat-containing protein [Planctomycetota bacterium]
MSTSTRAGAFLVITAFSQSLWGQGIVSFAGEVCQSLSTGLTIQQFVDRDLDGDLDALALDQFSSEMRFVRNDGPSTLTLQPPASVTANPRRAQSGDFDGDGTTDYARLTTSLLRPMGVDLVIERRQGSGFQSLRMDAGDGLLNALRAADVDGDGDLDLVLLSVELFSSLPLTTMRSWIQEPGFRFLESPALTLVTGNIIGFGGSVDLRFADADADGKDDVWVLVETLGIFGPQTTMTVLRRTPSGILTAAASTPVSFPTGLTTMGPVADIDQDGRAEPSRVVFSSATVAQSCFSANTSPPPVPLARQFRFVDGNRPRGFIGIGFSRSTVLEVFDVATNAPVTGLPVSVRLDLPNGTSTFSNLVSDAVGRIQPSLSTGALEGQGTLLLKAPLTAPNWTPVPINSFQAILNLSPPSGPPFVSIRFKHGNLTAMPFLLGVDLPQPAPIATPFGTVHTSLLAPTPSFGFLDGLGLFGPVDPTAVAAPEFLQIFPLTAGVPIGLTIVLQLYAYDGNLSFPHNIVVSPPRTLAF